MERETPFARLPPEPGTAPTFTETHLGTVESVRDPDSLNRVQVRLHTMGHTDGQEGLVWARVAVPVAGRNRGTFFLPNVGDEVLVSFVAGDPRFPVVVGSLWNGADAAPETLGGSGDAIDRWTIVGVAGTRIAIVEEQAGPVISLTTPGGVTGTFTDQGGGKVELQTTSGTVIIEPSGITIRTSGTVTVDASQVSVSAGMVQVSAGMSTFSGVVQCDTLIATTVVASTYTPGAGNVW